jgi:cobalamin biosynthesis protein CobD/CbiB
MSCLSVLAPRSAFRPLSMYVLVICAFDRQFAKFSRSQATRLGGKVMLIGMGSPNVMLPLSAAACREVDLIGVFRYVALAFLCLLRRLSSRP